MTRGHVLFSALSKVRVTEPSRRDIAGERRALASVAPSRELRSSSDSANPAAPDFRPLAVCGSPVPEPSSPSRRSPGADRREIPTRVVFVADRPKRVMAKAKQPASHAQAVGWRLKIFWPPIGKSFSGVVLAFDPLSGNHTVRWDETVDGQTGLTEVNLAEGIVTWTASPDGVAAGGKRSTPTNKKPKAPSSETLEQVEKRIGKNTIKGICFAVLKNAGPQGMLLAEIVAETQRRGLKDWSDVRQPSNTVNACCSGDAAFVKVAPGRVGLVCLGAHESPDLAAQEEREHGEKVLYCEACESGPFNTKGMRMHISRWCAYAPGNALEHEGRVPRAVTDREAAARDNAVTKTAKGGAAKKGGVGEKGSGGKKRGGGADKDAEEGAKTNICPACGAGPFNEKGIAMHSSRWCKARVDHGMNGVGGGFGSPLEDILGIGEAKPSGKRRKGSDPSSPQTLGFPGSFSTGGLDFAALFNNMGGATPTMVAPGPGAAGGFARGLMDMMARTFSGGFSGGLSGGVLGGLRGGNMNATAEQECASELKIDVEVYKEDGTFVARAPLVVSTEVTLGDLKIAVEVNTKGALPPHRQKLRYNDKPLPEDDTVPLRRFTGIPKDKINMHLTIVSEA